MNYPHTLPLLAACCALGAILAACAPVSLPPAPPQESAAPTTAITLAVTTQAPTPTQPPPTSTLPPNPTDTPIPPSPTPEPLPVDFPKPGTVVLDFVALVCNARWANGAINLPCPGDPDDLAEGYIMPADQAVAEGAIPVAAPVLIGLPGLGGEHGAGLFGIYPPLAIQPGDTFHAILACQEGAACDVEFGLVFIDAEGNYRHDMGWSWRHRFGGGPVPVQADLSPLAGQTVELALVVQDQGSPEDDWVLWIYPYVARAAP